MGLACHNYNDVNLKLPAAFNGRVTTTKKNGNVFYFILPYMEQDALYNSTNDPVDDLSVPALPAGQQNYVRAQLVKAFLCPSATISPDGRWFGTDWATGHYGFNYMVFGSPTTDSGGANPPWDRKLSVATIRDGTSNTVLFAERSGLFSNNTGNLWLHGGWNSNYMPMFGYNGNYQVFQQRPTQAQSTPFVTQSPHGSVMNTCLADGSVRGVSSSVSQPTWQNAIIPDDGNVLGSDW